MANDVNNAMQGHQVTASMECLASPKHTQTVQISENHTNSDLALGILTADI